MKHSLKEKRPRLTRMEMIEYAGKDLEARIKEIICALLKEKIHPIQRNRRKWR